MELLPALAFFIGAFYLVYRLRRLDAQVYELQERTKDRDGAE